MAASPPDLAARFRGSLLGLTVGDALGAPFEGWMPEAIRASHPTPQRLVEHPPVDRAHRRASPAIQLGPPQGQLYYTDDGQMALAVAEALLEGDPDPQTYANRFVGAFQCWRGYGRGARHTIDLLRQGVPPAEAARASFPDGSFANGAAMRVAPVGLRFCRDAAARAEHATRSAAPTHVHPEGVDGAQAIAAAVAWAATAEAFDRDALFDHASAAVTTDAMKERLEAARRVAPGDLLSLGHGIRAVDSVPTAIACFATHPSSYRDAVGTAVLLGGDCDTIAAMAGGIAGAFLGDRAIPQAWLDVLEDDANGRTAIADLATRLAAAV